MNIIDAIGPTAAAIDGSPRARGSFKWPSGPSGGRLKTLLHQKYKIELDLGFKRHPTRANYSRNLKIRVWGGGPYNSPLSIFAHPDQNPPWGPLKEPKIAAGYCLKGSVKNEGVQGRRGVGGRKPPPLKWSKHARFLAKDEGRRISAFRQTFPEPLQKRRFDGA